MKRFLPLWSCALALVFCGCATIRQTAESSGAGTNSVRHTTLTVRTLGDAKQIVESLRASNSEKTQTLGAKGIEQESTTTNLNAIIGDIVAAAVRAAAKP